MLDELKAVMQTTEFLRMSPQVQGLFNQRYNEHATFLQQEAQAAADAQQSQGMQSAVAQATQMAAAKAAAMTVDNVLGQLDAQEMQAPNTKAWLQQMGKREVEPQAKVR